MLSLEERRARKKIYNSIHGPPKGLLAKRVRVCKKCGRRTQNYFYCHSCWVRIEAPNECCGYEIDGTHINAFEYQDPYRFVVDAAVSNTSLMSRRILGIKK